MSYFIHFVFRNAGYDESLQLLEARGFVLSVHATCAVTVTRQMLDAELLQYAIERPILAYGQQKLFYDGQLILLVFGSNNGVSLGISSNLENIAEVTVEVTLNNAVTHTDSLEVTAILAPGEFRLVHHILPLDISKRISWDCDVHWRVWS